MSGTTNLSANVPQPSLAATNPTTGTPTREWYYMWLQLWNRTGGAQGVSSSDTSSTAGAAYGLSLLGLEDDGDTQAIAMPRISDLGVQIAFADAGEAVNLASVVFTALAFQDEPERPNWSIPILTALALTDEAS
ncbi:MAG TPA: hypothetical protein VHA37_10250 [Candidatus Saccharimonadales bacterium]|nr:hypothetical protein [Candidatus Saccharimonadales bacterium]